MTQSPGFGLGLRTAHYADFLAGPQPVDWLEVVTDNFLGDGGKPLAVLERLRSDYPMAMHGVAMSLGSADGLDVAYLQRVKRLADRIEPLWVSDHLCWSGQGGRVLHDLYPLPFTEACGRRLVSQIREAQQRLERRLVIENVSSYLQFAGDGLSEWEFLAWLVEEADCELLLDVNNVYVSSVNHGFDASAYLRALPPARVRQIHLAGHSSTDGGLIDTHDHPVAEPVWALYREACARFGAVATMIERDDRLPPLAELLDELAIARGIAAATSPLDGEAPPPPRFAAADVAQPLAALQQDFAEMLLAAAPSLTSGLRDDGRLPALRGAQIYHHAYRARLRDVLAEHYPKVLSYAGAALFDEWAATFIASAAPTSRSLSVYGQGFAGHLALRYPHNTELADLASLEWAFRCVFDAADSAAWSVERVATAGADRCLQQWPIRHPTLSLLAVRSNVIAIWRALEDEAEVPPPERFAEPAWLAIWRQGLQPHFVSVEASEAELLDAMSSHSIAEACEQLPALPNANQLASWLQRWWREGLLLELS